MRRDDGCAFPREEGREWAAVVLRRPSFLVFARQSVGRAKGEEETVEGDPY
jgi:hypothetical protein